MPPDPLPQRLRVLIAGGGVAAVECLLGLRELAGDRVDLTLLSDSRRFSERALALGEPFGGAPAQRMDLAGFATEHGARFVHGWLDAVDPATHTVTTREGAVLSYDVLVVATGAAPRLPWGRAEALDAGAPAMLEGLRHAIRTHRHPLHRLIVALPSGPHWPLPGYELALLIARDPELPGTQVTLVTAEEAPLHLFGAHASDAVAAELAAAGVRLICGHGLHLSTTDPIVATLWPGEETLEVDRVVAVPELRAHTLRGVPTDEHGFLPTDGGGRVIGVEDVYAAGDCTAFALKQGGLAAQQADEVVAELARRAGVDVPARPREVVLRARLLTGDGDLWMRRDLLRPGDRGEVGAHALWWPPAKIAGRWLAPYLDARRDAAAGVPHPPAKGRPLPSSGPVPDAPAVPVPRDLDLLGDPQDLPRTSR